MSGSILDKYKPKASKGVFLVVRGARLSGKSTLAGTLPGKTILAQAAILETGSGSAQALAKKLGRDLTIVEFKTLEELKEITDIFRASTEFDNLYIDGITAISELKYREPRVNRKVSGTGNMVWEGFREIADATEKIVEDCKTIAETTGKNVFLTLATDPKYDSVGAIIEMVPITKGDASVKRLEKYANNTIMVVSKTTDKGETHRELITRNTGVYTARIDSLLDDQNPGIVQPDLSLILNIIKESNK